MYRLATTIVVTISVGICNSSILVEDVLLRLREKIPCAVFDLDGTIIDSDGLALRTMAPIVAEFIPGTVYTIEEHRHLMGRPGAQWLDIMTNKVKLTDADTWSKIHARFTDQLGAALDNGELELIRGAADLINVLYAAGIPMAIGTNAVRKFAEGKMVKSFPDLYSKFTTMVCVSDDKSLKSKPDPAIYLEAAKRLLAQADEGLLRGGREASQCIVFDDSEPGIMAGLNAGMKVVGIRDPRWVSAEEDLVSEKPSVYDKVNWVVEDLQSVVDNIEHLCAL